MRTVFLLFFTTKQPKRMKFQHFSTLSSFILLLLFCLGVSNCRKDEWHGQTTWIGTVRMLGTEEPIPNIRLKLYAVLGSGSFLGSTSWTLLEEKYSKADGGFSFEYLDPKDGTYYVIVPEANYYFINSSNYTRVLNGSPEITKDVIMHPYAWVRVRIKINPPAIYKRLDIGGLSGLNYYVFSNETDTVVTGYLEGNSLDAKFRYFIYDENEPSGVSFFPQLEYLALDTVDYSIEF